MLVKGLKAKLKINVTSFSLRWTFLYKIVWWQLSKWLLIYQVFFISITEDFQFSFSLKGFLLLILKSKDIFRKKHYTVIVTTLLELNKQKDSI